jgi:hypothetical protein
MRSVRNKETLIMRRLTTALALTLAAAGTAGGDTFEPAAIAPEMGVETLTQEVARDRLDRDLFSNPYSSVVIANIDVYDRFPYLESRYFQIVSDPGWNRLLMGETDKGLFAYDGAGTPFGPLSGPHGLALGPDGRVYVCDTGNNRILVLTAQSEFDRITLTPVDAVTGLRRPYDVAYSDGGTPETPGDDRLYVAESGANRVASYAVTDRGYRFLDAIGELGSGAGRFAGPMAVAVGHNGGVNTNDVYVADAHNRRIVHLRDGAEGLTWEGAQGHTMNLVTSLDTDHWGSVYVTGPDRGVAKYTAALEPLDTLDLAGARPRTFHVVFANVHDHVRGVTERAGLAQAVVVEGWSPRTGLARVDLGVGIKDLAVRTEGGVSASFLLTDRARVTAEIVDRGTGTVMARRQETLDPGRSTVAFAPEDYVHSLGGGSYGVRLAASSGYAGGAASQVAEAAFPGGSGYAYLTRPLLLGNSPNPFHAATEIRFVVPDGPARPAVIRIFDIQGRVVRALFAADVGPGLMTVGWDGRDDGGRDRSTGIYFYRVTIGDVHLVSKMMLIR